MKKLRVVSEIDEDIWEELDGTTFTAETNIGEVDIELHIDPDTGEVYFTDTRGNDAIITSEELLKLIIEEIESYGLKVVVEEE